jgi:hypothetical protein
MPDRGQIGPDETARPRLAQISNDSGGKERVACDDKRYEWQRKCEHDEICEHRESLRWLCRGVADEPANAGEAKAAMGPEVRL